MRKKDKFNSNSTVYNREERFKLRCSVCPPNKGENKKCHKKHGVKKKRKLYRTK